MRSKTLFLLGAAMVVVLSTPGVLAVSITPPEVGSTVVTITGAAIPVSLRSCCSSR